MQFASVLTIAILQLVSGRRLGWTKTGAARNLAAAGVPDPTCKTGVLSLDGKVCCAGYCGECSDYETCKSVRGQDSKNACCMTAVAELECGKGAAANVCLKKCSEGVPPCITDDELPPLEPASRHAQTDCNKAVTAWRERAENAVAVPE